MTRINLVDPYTLSDQHLLAEYRELPRVFTNVQKAIDNNKTIKDFKISNKFCLGTGHVTFFYNKLDFLYKRQQLLINECKNRGFNIQYTEILCINNTIWNNDWIPTEDDIKLSYSRLLDKININKKIYKYYGKGVYK